MSIRPNFYGIELEKFKRIFGSKNSRAASALFKKYHDNLVVVDGVKAYEISEEGDKKIIEEAVSAGGDKVIQLEKRYPYLMFDLLTQQKGTIHTESDDWRYYHQEYFVNLLDKLEGKILLLIEYFIVGRKVFSDGITETELPYAYLTKSEIKVILKDMKSNWERYDDPQGFGKDFRDWMEKFAAKGKDLFFTQG